MHDRPPQTLMSPGPPLPSRGRSPVFFIVLFLVAIVGIAGGAIAVLYFVVGRASSGAIVGLDAASAATVATVPLVTSVSTPATVADAHAPLPTATHVAPHSATSGVTNPAKTAPAAAKAGGGECMCHPTSGMTMSLCPKEQLDVSTCNCDAVSGGMTLCPIPWKLPDGCSATGTFGGTPAAKDGDPCSGFNGGTKKDGSYSNEKLDGKLASCWPCRIADTYTGKIGAPCVGYRNERVPVNGVIDCSNLEFDCKRGDAAACTKLAAHK